MRELYEHINHTLIVYLCSEDGKIALSYASCNFTAILAKTHKVIPNFTPACAVTYTNWRASEASETLFSHVYGNSRYIFIYICTSVSNTHVRVNVFLRIKFKS